MKKIDGKKVKNFIKKYLIGEILVIALILFVDLLSKALMANADANGNGNIVIIPNVLNFTYVENTGAAFSMLEDQMWLFILLASLATVGFGAFLFFKRKGSKFLTYTIATLLAGTVGNLIDRIAFGYVRDFIHFNINFAIFNIADCALTIGAVLLCVYYIFIYKDKPKISKVEMPQGEENESKEGLATFHMEEEEVELPDYSKMKMQDEPFDMSCLDLSKYNNCDDEESKS